MPRGTPLRLVKYGVAVVLIAALSALQAPYQYGNGNQVFQIPKVHQLMTPDLFPDDELVDSLRNYPSVAYPAIAALTSTLGAELETVYFVLWLLERLALVALLMLIASRFINDFSGRVFVTLVACTAQWAIRVTPIGGEHLFASHMTHTKLAFVVQAAALAAWLHRREILTGALLGAAVYLNAMTTVHVAGFIALLWLMAEDRFAKRYLWSMVAMVIVAAPFTASVYQAMAGSAGAAGSTERFWELLRIRGGAHYFLSALHFAAFASVALVLWLLERVRRPDPALHRMIVAGIIYMAAMYVVSFFGVHLGASKLTILFHPLRGDKMLFLTFVVALPTILWQASKHVTADRAAVVLLPAICAVFMMGYTPPIVALVVLPALVAALALLGERREIIGLDARYAALGVMAVTVSGLITLQNATTYAVALFVGAAAGASAALLTGRSRLRLVMLAVVSVIAVGLMARGTGLTRGEFEWYRAREDRSYVEVAQWAADETGTKTRFITPTWMEGWRCLSRRSTLAQYRDLSAMHWDVGFEEALWDRLQALNGAVYFGPDLTEELRDGYLGLRPSDLVAAATRFNIDYVVMPAEWPPGEGLTSMYANSGYEVFTTAELQRAAALERGEDQ